MHGVLYKDRYGVPRFERISDLQLYSTVYVVYAMATLACSYDDKSLRHATNHCIYRLRNPLAGLMPFRHVNVKCIVTACWAMLILIIEVHFYTVSVAFEYGNPKLSDSNSQLYVCI